MQTARERLYLTADRANLVREGDPKAAFLYAAKGDEIPASAADRFGLVDGRLRSRKPAALNGSSTMDASYQIGGKTVQLGALVAEAHKRSQLTAEQWNALDAGVRDGLIGVVLEERQAAAAAVPPPKRPAPAPKKKAAASKDKAPTGKEQQPAEDKEKKANENKGS